MFSLREFPKNIATIALPKPALAVDALSNALSLRKTTRIYAPKEISTETLSNILWAAQGVAVTKGIEHKTIPMAYGIDYLKIFVLNASGGFVYAPKEHSLNKLIETDIRALSGTQAFVATAPLSLVYALDHGIISTRKRTSRANRTLYGQVSAGAACQNVSLYTTGLGLVSGVRADINRKSLYKALELPQSIHIIIAQSIGFAA